MSRYVDLPGRISRLMRLSKSFMKLTLVWKAFPEDVGIIWRGESTSQFSWTPEEESKLREMYATESHQAILNAIPNRS